MNSRNFVTNHYPTIQDLITQNLTPEQIKTLIPYLQDNKFKSMLQHIRNKRLNQPQTIIFINPECFVFERREKYPHFYDKSPSSIPNFLTEISALGRMIDSTKPQKLNMHEIQLGGDYYIGYEANQGAPTYYKNNLIYEIPSISYRKSIKQAANYWTNGPFKIVFVSQYRNVETQKDIVSFLYLLYLITNEEEIATNKAIIEAIKTIDEITKGDGVTLPYCTLPFNELFEKFPPIYDHNGKIINEKLKEKIDTTISRLTFLSCYKNEKKPEEQMEDYIKQYEFETGLCCKNGDFNIVSLVEGMQYQSMILKTYELGGFSLISEPECGLGNYENYTEDFLSKLHDNGIDPTWPIIYKDFNIAYDRVLDKMWAQVVYGITDTMSEINLRKIVEGDKAKALKMVNPHLIIKRG